MKANMKILQEKLLKKMVRFECMLSCNYQAFVCFSVCFIKQVLAFESRLALNLWSSHLNLQNAQIIAMDHHTCLLFIFLWVFGEDKFKLMTFSCFFLLIMGTLLK